MKTIYPTKPELDRAAWILSTMSPDMVDDIIALVNYRGNALRGDIFGVGSIPNETALIRYNSIFSRDYITDEDLPEVMIGVAAAFTSELRKPQFSTDRYSQILQTAFNIPAGMAESMASKIDTQDPISESDENEPWYTEMKNSIVEGVRKALNYGASLLQLDWEIDQNQDYDLDFLYEMKLLGRQVSELNSRSRLMSAQALIRTSGSFLQTKGDPSSHSAEAMIGDALRPFSMRRMPKAFFGGASNVVKLGSQASKINLQRQLSDAGVDSNLQPTTNTPAAPEKRDALTSIGNMKPGMATLLGAGIGLTPALINLVRSVLGGGATGDPVANEAIKELYGDVASEGLISGNLEPLIDLLIADSSKSFTTGDPGLDEAIDKEINAEQILGMGGPLQQLRVNMMRRQAAARRRRNVRHSGRMEKRDRYFNERQNAKRAKNRTYTNDFADTSLEDGGSSFEEPEFFEDEGEFYDDEGW